MGAESAVGRTVLAASQQRRLRSLESRVRTRRRALGGPQSFLELVGSGDTSDIEKEERGLQTRQERLEGQVERRESRRANIERQATQSGILFGQDPSQIQVQTLTPRNLRPEIGLRQIQLQQIGLQEERGRRRRRLLSQAFDSPLTVQNLQRRQLTGV